MSRRRHARPHGQIRQSQLITSFGPGSMLDLPDHSALVGGLDSWSTGGDEIIEPRLVDKLKDLFEPALKNLKLFSPPPDNDDPTAPQTGITAWQFPADPRCDLEARSRSSPAGNTHCSPCGLRGG